MPWKGQNCEDSRRNKQELRLLTKSYINDVDGKRNQVEMHFEGQKGWLVLSIKLEGRLGCYGKTAVLRE